MKNAPVSEVPKKVSKIAQVGTALAVAQKQLKVAVSAVGNEADNADYGKMGGTTGYRPNKR